MPPERQDFPDYRDFLRRELEARRQRNGAYSLRAFARSLGISPAHLSGVLTQRKSLGEPLAHRLAALLAWDSPQRKLFIDLVRYESSSTPEQAADLAANIAVRLEKSPFQKIDGGAEGESFSWYHMVIADLFSLRSFQPKARWIAAKVGLTVIETEAALACLRRMGVIAGSGAKLCRLLDNFVLSTKPEVHNRIYMQLMDKARSAMSADAGPGELTAITMSFDACRWQEAMTRIRAFQADMARLSKPGEDDSIYQLGIQFVRLDKPRAG